MMIPSTYEWFWKKKHMYHAGTTLKLEILLASVLVGFFFFSPSKGYATHLYWINWTSLSVLWEKRPFHFSGTQGKYVYFIMPCYQQVTLSAYILFAPKQASSSQVNFCVFKHKMHWNECIQWNLTSKYLIVLNSKQEIWYYIYYIIFGGPKYNPWKSF